MSDSISLAIADPVAARTAVVLDRLFPSPRDVAIRLWDGTELPAASGPAFTLVLKHPGATGCPWPGPAAWRAALPRA